MTNDKVIAFLRKVILDPIAVSSLKAEAIDLIVELASAGEQSVFGNTVTIYDKGNHKIYGTYSSTYDVITQNEYDIINDLLANKQKINAIKEIRRLTQWGLKDSKDCSENRSFSNGQPDP